MFRVKNNFHLARTFHADVRLWQHTFAISLNQNLNFLPPSRLSLNHKFDETALQISHSGGVLCLERSGKRLRRINLWKCFIFFTTDDDSRKNYSAELQKRRIRRVININFVKHNITQKVYITATVLRNGVGGTSSEDCFNRFHPY